MNFFNSKKSQRLLIVCAIIVLGFSQVIFWGALGKLSQIPDRDPEYLRLRDKVERLHVQAEAFYLLRDDIYRGFFVEKLNELEESQNEGTLTENERGTLNHFAKIYKEYSQKQSSIINGDKELVITEYVNHQEEFAATLSAFDKKCGKIMDGPRLKSSESYTDDLRLRYLSDSQSVDF